MTNSFFYSKVGEMFNIKRQKKSSQEKLLRLKRAEDMAQQVKKMLTETDQRLILMIKE